MRKFINFAGVPLVGILFCGCFGTHSPYLLISSIEHRYWSLEDVQKLEASDPSAARAEYEQLLLKTPAPTLDYEKYAQNLSDELEDLKGEQTARSAAVVSTDSVFGIMSYYDLQLETLAKVHQGLARLHLAGGRLEPAQVEAGLALKIAETKLKSPVSLYNVSSESYALLAKIYRKQGHRGRTLKAETKWRILADYSASPQGKKDYFLYRQMLSEDQGAAKKINTFLVDINVARITASGEAFNKAAAVLGTVASSMQQMSINQQLAKSGGVTTPRIQMMQMQKMMLDFNTQLVAARAGMPAAPAGGGAAGSTADNHILVGQLVNAGMGDNVGTILKGFCQAAGALGGSKKLRQAAQSVAEMTDALMQARQQGPQAALPVAAKYASSLENLEREVDEIK